MSKMLMKKVASTAKQGAKIGAASGTILGAPIGALAGTGIGLAIANRKLKNKDSLEKDKGRTYLKHALIGLGTGTAIGAGAGGGIGSAYGSREKSSIRRSLDKEEAIKAEFAKRNRILRQQQEELNSAIENLVARRKQIFGDYVK